MLKVKYLHRRIRKDNRKNWYSKKYKREHNNTINEFSELPLYQSIRGKYSDWYNFDTRPLYEFMYSKVGENWDDVYSEIVKKIKPKYRHAIEYTLVHRLNSFIFDENFIPRYPSGRIASDTLFIDMNNILCYKNKEELLLDSKKYIRSQKLKDILESQEIENTENQSED
jgi:hypothetical protein